MAARITFLYLAIGLLWIAGSDWALPVLVNTLAVTPETSRWLNSWKGFFYVGTTAILLYLYLKSSIARLHESEQRYFQSNQNLEALINNTRDLIWSVSKDYKFISVNKALQEKIYLICDQEVRPGDSVFIPQLGPAERQKWQQYYEQVLAGEELHIEENFSFKNNTIISFGELSLNPIRDIEGQVIGVGCFNRDITQTKKHLEKIQNQYEKLREIAWIQSHELRAPVANILGLVNLISLKETGDPENEVVIQKLKISTQQLDAVVHEIVSKANEVEISNDGF